MTSRLKEKYTNEVVPFLVERFKYENIMQVPRLEKIVLNMGLGSSKENPKAIESAVKELETIREGMNVGVKVTLRGEKMYDFLDKFMNISLPRVRDFRGISSKSFDGRGNYAVGIKEQLIFPEIEYDMVDQIRGMDIVVVTTANTDEEAKELLDKMGMPFKK